MISKDELRGPVVPGTDVRHARLSGLQFLCRTEVTQLQNVRFLVHKQVLGLYISVAHSDSVDVANRPEHLVSVQLHKKSRHVLLFLVVVPHNSVNSIWDVVHNDIEVDLVTITIARRIEVVLHLYYVRMVELLHHLQFSVLKSFVLEDFLYGYNFSCFLNFGLVNYSKSSVSNYLFCIVSEGLLRVKKGLPFASFCFLSTADFGLRLPRFTLG